MTKVESVLVNVTDLHPAGKDAFMHYVDLARGGFDSTPLSPKCQTSLCRIVEDAFWGTATSVSHSSSAVEDPGSGLVADSEPQTTLTVLEALLAGDAVCAALFTGDSASATLSRVLWGLCTVPRTARVLASDVLETATKALTANQMQTALSVSSHRVSVGTLQQINRRHLFALRQSSNQDASAAGLVYKTAFAPSSTRPVRWDLLSDDLAHALKFPRSAEALLRAMLRERCADADEGNAAHADTLVKKVRCSLPESVSAVAAGLLEDDTMQAKALLVREAVGALSVNSPLLPLVLDCVMPCTNPFGCGTCHSPIPTWKALQTELRVAYLRLKQREDVLLTCSSFATSGALDDERNMADAATQGLRRGGVSCLWAGGSFDASVSERALRRQFCFAGIPLRGPRERVRLAGAGGGEGAEAFDEAKLAVPAIPSIGVDYGSYLTGVLRACDVLCAALGIDAGQSVTAKRATEPFAGGGSNNNGTGCLHVFAADVLTLRHLARVSLARRYMMRPPHALWQQQQPQGLGPSFDLGTLDKLRAFPFLAEVTRSLSAAASPPSRLVVLRVCWHPHVTDSEPRGLSDEHTCEYDAARALLLSSSYLFPEWAPQLLSTYVQDASPSLAAPLSAKHLLDSDAAGRRMTTLRCWPALSLAMHCANQPSDVDTLVELQLAAHHVEELWSHRRRSQNDEDSRYRVFALSCHGNRCRALCPLELLSFSRLQEWLGPA